MPPPDTADSGSWFALDMTTLGIAFVLTLGVGIYAYLSNAELGADGLFFVLLAFCALVFAARRLGRRFFAGRKSKT